MRAAISILFALLCVVVSQGISGSQTIHLAAAPQATPEEPETQFAANALDGVQDRTRGIRGQERDAYFRLLDHADRVSLDRQRKAARSNIARFQHQFETEQREALKQDPSRTRYRYSLYPELLRIPEEYRGKSITLRGRVRRLEEMPLADGEQDRGTAYQAYLFTDDSRTHPYIIVCRHVPPEMPRGGDILEEVEVTGYFFKIYAYDAQDTSRVAPLFIAQRIEWFPRQAPQPIISPILGAIVAAVALLIIITLLWKISRKDRRIREQRLDQMADEAEPFSSS